MQNMGKSCLSAPTNFKAIFGINALTATPFCSIKNCDKLLLQYFADSKKNHNFAVAACLPPQRRGLCSLTATRTYNKTYT